MEGDQLESYFHLRVPASEPLRRSAADADLTIDFLEPLSQDPFKGRCIISAVGIISEEVRQGS